MFGFCCCRTFTVPFGTNGLNFTSDICILQSGCDKVAEIGKFNFLCKAVAYFC